MKEIWSLPSSPNLQAEVWGSGIEFQRVTLFLAYSLPSFEIHVQIIIHFLKIKHIDLAIFFSLKQNTLIIKVGYAAMLLMSLDIQKAFCKY